MLGGLHLLFIWTFYVFIYWFYLRFMCRLHDQLKYFVSMKISTDTLWQGVKVILSGHETPGEGEHKVMDYIRFEKAQPG
jgi:5'-3' exoribonuclease 1